MAEWSRAFFLVGALPFLILGAAHARATPRREDERRGLSPRDPGLAAAMAGCAPRLTARTDLWRCWVGFNYSHSVGAVAFGALVLLAGRSSAAWALEAAVFLPAAVLVCALYLVLAVRYWFSIPITGVAVALAAFLASGALRLAGH